MELMLTRVMSNAVSTGIAIGMGAKPPLTSFAPGFESRHDARDERQASQGEYIDNILVLKYSFLSGPSRRS